MLVLIELSIKRINKKMKNNKLILNQLSLDDLAALFKENHILTNPSFIINTKFIINKL